MLFKRVVLLNACDTVLFAESIEELQDLLDKCKIYYSQWKRKVNPEKSKVLIFGDTSRHKSLIRFNDQPLEVVDCFEYLGVVLPKSRTFYQTKNHIVDQAKNELFWFI